MRAGGVTREAEHRVFAGSYSRGSNALQLCADGGFPPFGAGGGAWQKQPNKGRYRRPAPPTTKYNER